MRYTIKDLRNTVEVCNTKLENEGIPFRFKEQGRNGYQAVDLFSLAGKCLRNIGCGTSKEVIEHVVDHCYSVSHRYLSNYLFKKGMDVNGNRLLRVRNHRSGKAFSVQTLGNLPSIHKALRGGVLCNDLVIQELNKFLLEHGTKRQKEIMQLI